MYIFLFLFIFITNKSYASFLQQPTSTNLSRSTMTNPNQLIIQKKYDQFAKFTEELNDWYNHTTNNHIVALLESFEIIFPGVYQKFLIQLQIEYDRHQKYQDDGIATENHPRDCYDQWQALCIFTQDEIKSESINEWIALVDQHSIALQKKRIRNRKRHKAKPMTYRPGL